MDKSCVKIRKNKITIKQGEVFINENIKVTVTKFMSTLKEIQTIHEKIQESQQWFSTLPLQNKSHFLFHSFFWCLSALPPFTYPKEPQKKTFSFLPFKMPKSQLKLNFAYPLSLPVLLLPTLFLKSHLLFFSQSSFSPLLLPSC